MPSHPMHDASRPRISRAGELAQLDPRVRSDSVDAVAQTVRLTNLARGPADFELAHAVVCVAEEHCTCTRQLVQVRTHDAKTGQREASGSKQRMSRVVSLAPRGEPGATATGLPLSVQTLEQVVMAKRLGLLSVEVEKPAHVTPPAPVQPPSAPVSKGKKTPDAAAKEPV